MSAVWDRTVDVLKGRAGILATVALLLVALPSIVQTALGASAGSGSGAGLVTVIGVVLTMWGTLAMTAIASDPDVDRAAGLRVGSRALPRAIAVMLVLGILATLLFVPGIVLLMRSGYDLAAAARNDHVAAMANADLGGFVAYALVFGIAMLWAAARLILIYPVLTNEGGWLSAIRRSFALTRGLTARIIGVLLLYLVVLTVCVFAAQAVFGTVFRLVLGSEQALLAATLTSALVSAIVSGFTVVQTVFAAQLYVAVRPPEVQHHVPDPARSGPWA